VVETAREPDRDVIEGPDHGQFLDAQALQRGLSLGACEVSDAAAGAEIIECSKRLDVVSCSSDAFGGATQQAETAFAGLGISQERRYGRAFKNTSGPVRARPEPSIGRGWECPAPCAVIRRDE
jgi:hypothetical protein